MIYEYIRIQEYLEQQKKKSRKPVRCSIVKSENRTENINLLSMDYELIFLLEGEGEYLDSEGLRHRLVAGTILQLLPGQQYSFNLHEDSLTLHMISIMEVFLLLQSTVSDFTEKVVHFTGISRILVKRWLDLLDKESTGIGLFSFMVLQQEIISLCVELSQQQEDIHESSLDVIMESAADLLSSDFSRNISGKDAAELLGMNYHTFRRTFTRIYNESPSRFRQRIKMNQAESLVCSTSSSLTEISEQLGYTDLYTFSSQFKKQRGVSPSRLR